MPKITATDHEGKAHVLEASAGDMLMESLRDADLVEATCGGAASCGTCHVYVGNDWLDKTGERTEDEGYMLESLEEHVEIKESSRLACQVQISDEHDGLALEIAPQI